MGRIGITGAGGTVGRAILDAFDDHEIVPYTHSEHEDIDSVLLDVTDPEDVQGTLDDVDGLVHLAGASEPDADWEAVVDRNVLGTKHVLDAALDHDVDRVVFASSNHAVGMYNAVDADPERMTTDYAHPVGPDAPTRPDSFYGVSKVACEGLTDYYADAHDIEVVNLRIGWFMDEEQLRTTVDEADPERARFARATWLSPRDCRDVHRRAVTADLPDSPVTLNAVSANDERVHSITETMRTLGYTPRDNSASVLGG
jgi:L-arabinose 1-dehydrogenase [NAD(P)+]